MEVDILIFETRSQFPLNCELDKRKHQSLLMYLSVLSTLCILRDHTVISESPLSGTTWILDLPGLEGVKEGKTYRNTH